MPVVCRQFLWLGMSHLLFHCIYLASGISLSCSSILFQYMQTRIKLQISILELGEIDFLFKPHLNDK